MGNYKSETSKHTKQRGKKIYLHQIVNVLNQASDKSKSKQEAIDELISFQQYLLEHVGKVNEMLLINSMEQLINIASEDYRRHYLPSFVQIVIADFVRKVNARYSAYPEHEIKASILNMGPQLFLRHSVFSKSWYRTNKYLDALWSNPVKMVSILPLLADLKDTETRSYCLNTILQDTVFRNNPYLTAILENAEATKQLLQVLDDHPNLQNFLCQSRLSSHLQNQIGFQQQIARYKSVQKDAKQKLEFELYNKIGGQSGLSSAIQKTLKVTAAQPYVNGQTIADTIVDLVKCSLKVYNVNQTPIETYLNKILKPYCWQFCQNPLLEKLAEDDEQLLKVMHSFNKLPNDALRERLWSVLLVSNRFRIQFDHIKKPANVLKPLTNPVGLIKPGDDIKQVVFFSKQNKLSLATKHGEAEYLAIWQQLRNAFSVQKTAQPPLSEKSDSNKLVCSVRQHHYELISCLQVDDKSQTGQGNHQTASEPKSYKLSELWSDDCYGYRPHKKLKQLTKQKTVANLPQIPEENVSSADYNLSC